jgi:hypothetical protein
VTPEALRHAYLLHLVRQGVRMSDITVVAGRLSPGLISAYAAYAPPGTRVALDATRAAFPLSRAPRDRARRALLTKGRGERRPVASTKPGSILDPARMTGFSASES